MFTGIVQDLGTLRHTLRDEAEFVIAAPIRERLFIGASVAVNGACLTVRRLNNDSFVATVSDETRRKTSLGSLRTGARVNLELPLTPQTGLDGHMVLGHVDCVGHVAALVRERTGWTLHVSYPGEFARYVAEKGSVAVDGISLTPFAVQPGSFRCAIVPETYENTTLRDRRSGDPVNLEFDVLAKYVERMMRDVHLD